MATASFFSCKNTRHSTRGSSQGENIAQVAEEASKHTVFSITDVGEYLGATMIRLENSASATF